MNEYSGDDLLEIVDRFSTSNAISPLEILGSNANVRQISCGIVQRLSFAN
jgi:hypothetical protein